MSDLRTKRRFALAMLIVGVLLLPLTGFGLHVGWAMGAHQSILVDAGSIAVVSFPGLFLYVFVLNYFMGGYARIVDMPPLMYLSVIIRLLAYPLILVGAVLLARSYISPDKLKRTSRPRTSGP